MKKFYSGIALLLVLFMSPFAGWGQTTISQQDFETSPVTPTLTFTNTNGAYSTGTNGAGGIPVNANLFSGGTRGWQAINETSTLTFANQSLTGFTNSFLSFRLAGMSINGTNGIDAFDIATIAISVDGGTSYSNEITIAGSAANQRWDFTSTGSSTITYDGNNVPTAITSSTGVGGISTVRVDIPNVNTQVRVRITLLNNDANERWVIDNVQIQGTFVGKVTTQNGDWNVGSTWVGGVAPLPSENVMVNHVVFSNSAIVRNVGTTTTIASTGNLGMGATYTNTGSTTVNGTFQLNAGGWATGNNFTYGAAGTLNFNDNLASSYVINAGDVFWPVANGPFNVNVLRGGITLNANRTVAGTFSVVNSGSMGVSFPAAVLTLNGTCRIDAGGYFNNGPLYGTSSTLLYNSGGNYNRIAEWGVAVPGQGYPYNVRISNSTTLIPGANLGTGLNLEMGGNLTIDAGSNFYMDFGALDMTVPIRVLGDVSCTGGLSLSDNAGGDLKIRGNLSFNAGYIFDAKNRALFFTRNGTQTITASSTPTFHYLVFEPVSGNTTVQLSGTDLNITAPLAGNVISFGTGNVFNINGRTLTLGTAGLANILNGTGTFSGSATSNLSLLGTGSIGTLNFTTGSQALGTLTLNRTVNGGATLGTALTVNSSLVLTSGLFTLGTNHLTLSALATVGGTPSATAMVVADGTGEFRKTFTAAGSFTFPVGDNTVPAEYSPATLTFAGGTYTAAYAGVRVVDAVHPNMFNADYITRYWPISTSGIAGATYSFAGVYTDADITGTEANMNGARYDASTVWIEGAAVNTGTNTATVNAQTTFTATNQFTAGHPLPPNPVGVISGLTPACGSTILSFSGTAPAGNTYYWQFNTATGTSTVNNAASTLAVTTSGNYYVRTRGNASGYWSPLSVGPYAVTINVQPVISSQPVSVSVTSPSTATFTVVATGSPLTYQWQFFDGVSWVNLANGAPYSGVTTSILSITPTNVSMDANTYRCILTGALPCTNVTSNPVILTVNPGPCVFESFTNIPASATNYVLRTWTGDNGGTWTASGARTDQTLTGRAICFGNTADNPRNLTSNINAGGMGTLTFNYVRGFTGTGGRTIQVWVNGVQIGADITVSNTSDVVQIYNNPINISGSVTLEIRSTGSSQVIIDDVSWSCFSGCMPTQTITGFTPTSGSQGTLVTITGTGFTAGTTSVKFGGVAASAFTFVDVNTIIAEVPVSGVTGKIAVTVAGCELQSGTDFTMLTTNTYCGSNAGTTGLIISEVFDSEVGALSYVEIFNPTIAAIALTNYSLDIITDGPTTTPYSLGSASIPSGGVFVVSIGDPTTTNTTICAAASPGLSYPAGSGFNGNDRVILKLSGANHDVVDNPNYGSPNNNSFRGFSQFRIAGNVTNRTTYVPSEWTNTTTENCSHINIPPSAISTTNVTITTQPIDVNCTAVTFSVAASAVPGVINYVWYYQAPGNTGWTLVSTLTGTNGLTVAGSGSNSITITGNTAILNDYQFYVLIGSGGSNQCLRYSRAIQYTYATRIYYRTRASGDWTNLNTWEMSNTEGSGYTFPVCQYPVATNSNKVNILNGHTVTLDIYSLNIDWVNINTGGALTINPNAGLSFNNGNGSGADFEINGTLTDRCNSGAGNGVSFNAGATWLMANSSSANIIKTNTSSVAAYRDNYQGGISLIPAAANWFFRYNADGNPNVVSSGMFYPNLYFESVSGPYNWNGFSTALTGGVGGFATVNGNLNVGTTGTGVVSVYNNNVNSQPLLIRGNVTIALGSILTNVSYDNVTDATHGDGTGFEIKGNLIVNGIFINNGAARLTGNLVFSGTGPQTISGTGTMTLEDVNINNSAGGVVTVNKNFDIPGTLDFGNAAAILTLGTGNITLKSTNSRTANVGIIPVGAGINYTTGKFIVERSLITARKWRLLSAPTSDAAQTVRSSWQEAGATPAGYGVWAVDTRASWSLLGFDAAGTNSSVKRFNSPAETWDAVANTNVLPISSEKGYMVFVAGDRFMRTLSPATPTTLRTSGTLYRNNQALGPIAASKFAVAGNPYASRVDLRLLNKSGVSNAFYVWDPSITGSYGLGAWNTFSYDIPSSSYQNLLTSGVYGTALTNNNFIESGQAFMVKDLGAGTGTVTFEENDKASGSFNPPASFTSGNPQFLRVNLSQLPSNGSAPILLDGLMANFNAANSNGIEANDIFKMTTFGENVSWKTADSLIVIDNRFEVRDNDTLHLVLSKMRAQNYQWQLILDNMDYPGRQAYLVDRYNQTNTLLNMAGTTTVNFSVQNIASSYAADRFLIIFKQASLGPVPVSFTSVSASRNPDQSIGVQWKTTHELNISNYEVERSSDGIHFNGIHSRVASYNNGGNATYNHTDAAAQYGDQFYRIRANSIGGQVQYSAIVKVSAIKTAPGISVYPNPVADGQVQVRFASQTPGLYQMQLSNAAGQVLYKAGIKVHSSMQVQTIDLPAQTAAGTYHLSISGADGTLKYIQVLVR
jgi:hypothetical protein